MSRLYLLEWRRERGMTQVEVARALDTDHSTVGRWERGERQVPLKKQAALAKLFGIPVWQLQYPPGRTSLDALLEGASEEQRAAAVRLVRAMLGEDPPQK